MGLRTITRNLYNKITNQKEKENERLLNEWELKGKPAPPPHIVKQNAIAFYQDKYKINILVETGTFMGNMIEAQLRRFNEIFSIELDQKLYNNAVKKFKKYSHVKLYQGDSGEVLSKITPLIKTPAIFWLDGHYSAGFTAKGILNTPIIKELKTVLDTKLDHIILIDDARCFNGTEDYPTTHEVKDFVMKYSDKYQMEVKDDIIRFFI